MNRFVTALWASLIWMVPTMAWAEESHGYSRGNAFVYYAVIAAILVYGVHDTFRIRTLTWAAAVVIPLSFYLMLPVK
jgi:hypothetical protein